MESHGNIAVFNFLHLLLFIRVRNGKGVCYGVRLWRTTHPLARWYGYGEALRN
jgi:hypothetical protein